MSHDTGPRAPIGADGRLDLDELLRRVRGGQDVPLAAMDEDERYWFGPAAGRPVPDAPDLPTLAAMGDDERLARLDAVAARLCTTGELIVDAGAEPAQLHRVGRRAMVGQLRGTAVARTLVRASASGGLVAVIHHLPVAVDLVQECLDGDVHAFVARSPERTAGWLAAVLDPARAATATGPMQRYQRPEQVVPSIARLRAAPSAHVLERRHRTRPEVRAAEVVAGPEVGVVTLQDFREGEHREIVVRTLSSSDLARFCHGILHADRGPGDRSVHTVDGVTRYGPRATPAPHRGALL